MKDALTIQTLVYSAWTNWESASSYSGVYVPVERILVQLVSNSVVVVYLVVAFSNRILKVAERKFDRVIETYCRWL